MTIVVSLVALDATVRGAVLLQPAVLRGLVVAASTAARIGAATGAGAAGVGGLAALAAGLVRVNLAVGEFASADAAIGLAVLAETVVL